MKKLQQRLEREHIETIRRCGLLEGVKEADYETVLESLQARLYGVREEEMIFLEGEEVTDLAILHSGTVRGEKFHLEGNVDLLYMYKRGEIFGAEATVSRLKTSPLTYIANETAELILIDFAGAMRQSCREGIMTALMHILADDNIKKLYKIETLSKRGMRDRIMTYLKIIEKKAGKEVFSLHMDRNQLAQYLCVNRSALSCELNRMKREGLIWFQKDRFKILEKDK